MLKCKEKVFAYNIYKESFLLHVLGQDLNHRNFREFIGQTQGITFAFTYTLYQEAAAVSLVNPAGAAYII